MLLYGPDEGLVRERADILARTVCADLSDPFRVADLSAAALAADPARLADEAAQLSLIGGRRVVRVHGAGDRLTGLFAGFLDDRPATRLIVVEAGDLPASLGIAPASSKPRPVRRRSAAIPIRRATAPQSSVRLWRAHR